MKLGSLVAIFSPKKNIKLFLKRLHDELDVNIKNVYIYDIEGNDTEYLITFKYLREDNNIDLKAFFSSATPVHVKNGCIFSINALNKLIERDCELDGFNLNYHNYKINWDKYHNKLILLNYGELCIHNIVKLDDNSVFFK
jgi:hypothetical protein